MKKLIYLIINIFLVGKELDPLKQASDAINSGLYVNALAYVIEAQKLEPFNPDVYRMKALLHESLGEPKKAIIAWEKCKKYSDNKEIKSEAQIHIKNLENAK
tara:strand:- start:1415 stop:1720 length:306 start_codon:yes stop_codon:yes gene_type:complete